MAGGCATWSAASLVYPTLPMGAGWVWVEMTYDGGALAVRGQWVGERVRWAR